MAVDYRPNVPGGSWAGPRAFGHMPRPPGGQAVVYGLYDDAACLVYIGSTGRFEDRIHVHKSVRRGKPFASWEAWPCIDRAHAYAVEARLIAEYRPRLNIAGTGQ